MKRTTLIVVILLFFTLSACKPDPNEQFIQGIWEFANESGDERSGKAHLFFRWQISNGSFQVEQEIVLGKPLISQGHYRILDSGEEEITLELYDVEGNFIVSDPYELRIQIDRENDTARFQKILFNRIWP